MWILVWIEPHDSPLRTTQLCFLCDRHIASRVAFGPMWAIGERRGACREICAPSLGSSGMRAVEAGAMGTFSSNYNLYINRIVVLVNIENTHTHWGLGTSQLHKRKSQKPTLHPTQLPSESESRDARSTRTKPGRGRASTPRSWRSVCASAAAAAPRAGLLASGLGTLGACPCCVQDARSKMPCIEDARHR